MRLSLPLAAFALLVTASVSAQDPTFTEGDFQLGVGLGVTAQLSPDGFKDVVDPAASASLFGVGRLGGPIALRGEFGFDRHACREQVCGRDDASLDIYRFVAGVQLMNSLASSSRAQGYAYATGGLFMQNARDVLDPLDKSQVGVSLGGGVNYLLTDDWGLGANVQVTGIFESDGVEDLWYVVPSMHVVWRF